MLLLGGFALAGLAVLGRAFQLQALEGDRWAERAAEQQRERDPLPARRGTIYDRDSVPLALSHESFRVSVAPRELRDRKATASRLREALGLSRSQADRATSTRRGWVVLAGRYTVQQREQLGEQRGVYFERELERFYPQGQVAREIIGVVSRDGRALGGIEQQFDASLRGQPGYSILRRDARGRAKRAISLPVVPPRDGADVYLTIDLDLQEIADAALRSAVRTTGASGGDLVLLDPRTGEVLAAVSRRSGGEGLAAITEPYEPGSTLKPFLAASLLARGRVTPRDSVFGENGRWQTAERTITDSHAAGWMSLADVIRESSNIGIVKFTSRLRPGEEYEYLRDFGFGTPTGVEFPAEANGRLRRPADWSRLSSGSLAMGYELSVTPLQIAAAYGALANGGVLMQPHLLREVRNEGRVLQSVEPRALRRVVPQETADRITEMLVSVVEDGTATHASLQTFRVAGKTGTARRTGAGGRYEAGSYTSSFAGYFPADDPQLVIFVKIDQPRGEYYGGLTAAPVTRETLQGILAAHTSALDGRSLLATRLPAQLPGSPRKAAAATPRSDPEGTYVFLMDDSAPAVRAAARRRSVAVPELAGLSIRDATRRVHAAGLRVRLQGGGSVQRSDPVAGVQRVEGDTVLLVGSGR
ncbi:MAG: hypothetical protein KY464_00075 [Gemmatimonadetes bacterium]|nr:hypothetical protein [Gemmatimonadota bacterium]